MLPDLASPTTTPSLIPSPPPNVPAPTLARPSRYDEKNEAKEVYLKGTPGRVKSGFLGALRGVAQGLATGGGLGAALGGAVAGGAGGAIDPRGLREQQFNERILPQIEERFKYEDAARAAQREDQAARIAAERALREDQTARVNIANTQSQIDARNAAEKRANDEQSFKQSQPILVDEGKTMVIPGKEPGTYTPVFTAARAPKPPTEAELMTEPTSGKSVEEIAEESYQKRGGNDYVLSKMSPRDRQLIERGTITVKETDKQGKQTGKDIEEDAEENEIARAQRAFDAAIERQRKADLDYTRGNVRSRRLRAGSAANSSSSQSGLSRSRSQFNTSKFPGLRFD